MKVDAMLDDITDYLKRYPQGRTLKEIQLAFCDIEPKIMQDIVNVLVKTNFVQVSLRGE
jgi:hypothetical protein